MLLPLNPTVVRQISMDNHLTLEVLRSGLAEMYHLGSMARAAYLARFLSEAGCGSARDGLFQEVDEAINRCRQGALDTSVWRVDDDAYSLLCEVLTLHDMQISLASVSALTVANEKLQKLVATE
ncbi:hypothetical protein R69746_08234 [Paraburkholderia aspalathi]|nr:hypothetical protein R69746_08234 [Paraburkholderia aspalathi]